MSIDLEEYRATISQLENSEYPTGYNLFDFNKMSYPQDFEPSLLHICATVAHNPDTVQHNLHCNPGSDSSDYFLVFAARLATQAVRCGESNLLMLGIVALILANRKDMRDNIALMAVLRDASLRIGVDFMECASKCERWANASQVTAFQKFNQRSDDLKDVSALGWTVMGDGADLTYVFA